MKAFSTHQYRSFVEKSISVLYVQDQKESWINPLSSDDRSFATVETPRLQTSLLAGIVLSVVRIADGPHHVLVLPCSSKMASVQLGGEGNKR
jgi:hypothetical protein